MGMNIFFSSWDLFFKKHSKFWLWKTLQHNGQKKKKKSDPQHNSSLSFTKHSTELQPQVKDNHTAEMILKKSCNQLKKKKLHINTLRYQLPH